MFNFPTMSGYSLVGGPVFILFRPLFRGNFAEFPRAARRFSAYS
jgi:hypothetical protein